MNHFDRLVTGSHFLRLWTCSSWVELSKNVNWDWPDGEYLSWVMSFASLPHSFGWVRACNEQLFQLFAVRIFADSAKLLKFVSRSLRVGFFLWAESEELLCPRTPAVGPRGSGPHCFPLPHSLTASSLTSLLNSIRQRKASMCGDSKSKRHRTFFSLKQQGPRCCGVS